MNGTNITESLGDADKVVEAVAVFTAAEKLQKAIDDLMSSGFDRADLSLLAPENGR
jgi:predicted CoA-binding protein